MLAGPNFPLCYLTANYLSVTLVARTSRFTEPFYFQEISSSREVLAQQGTPREGCHYVPRLKSFFFLFRLNIGT